MLQNIHQVPQRIANKKPPHAPGLFSNTVFKRNTCRMNAGEDFIKIILLQPINQAPEYLIRLH